MKWNIFSRRRHERQLDIPEDDSVHKRSKHLCSEECHFDEEKEHHRDQQQHADDRTEATHISCGSIDSPKAAPIPRHIVQHHDCLAIPENKSRSDPIVRFSTVEMRHYQRIVGDHPDVEIPLAIGWEFLQAPAVPVAEFEGQKEQARAVGDDDDERCDGGKKKELQLPFNTTHAINIMEPLEPSRLDSPPPAANNNNNNKNHHNKKAKALQRAAAFTENVRTGLLTHNHKPSSTALHKNSTELADKYLEPISMKERVFLLQTVGGLSLKQIHQAERRRRVQIVLEWAYR